MKEPLRQQQHGTPAQAGADGAAAAPEAPPADRLAASLPSARQRNWFLGLLLVAGTIFAYQPAWHGGFIWDDETHLVHNPHLVESDGLKRIWFSLEAPQYYPLVFTSFRIERALWGLNPVGYHFVNLLLHSASALLLWQLLRQLRVPGAWLAAAVFALHPVNVESVAWITERKNTLSMPFFLLSLLLYLRFDELSILQSLKSGVRSQNPPSGDTPRATRNAFHVSRFTFHASRSTFHAPRHSPSSVFYGLSLFAFVLALLSKTAVAPLPLVLLLLAWWRRGRIAGRGCVAHPAVLRGGAGADPAHHCLRASGRRRDRCGTMFSGRAWRAQAGPSGFISTRRCCRST